MESSTSKHRAEPKNLNWLARAASRAGLSSPPLHVTALAHDKMTSPTSGKRLLTRYIPTRGAGAGTKLMETALLLVLAVTPCLKCPTERLREYTSFGRHEPSIAPRRCKPREDSARQAGRHREGRAADRSVCVCEKFGSGVRFRGAQVLPAACLATGFMSVSARAGLGDAGVCGVVRQKRRIYLIRIA